MNGTLQIPADVDLKDLFQRDEGDLRDAPSFPQEEAKPVARRKIGQVGEQFTKAQMERLLKAVLDKRNDAPINRPDGTVIMVKKRIDYQGLVPIAAQKYAAHVEVEVKSFHGAFNVDMVSKEQYDFMEKRVAAGALGILSLVELEGMSVKQAWWIPWNTWTMIVRTLLPQRAGGNYTGKSIRQQEQVLLAPYLVEKVGGRWRLCNDHWLTELVGVHGQRRLL